MGSLDRNIRLMRWANGVASVRLVLAFALSHFLTFPLPALAQATQPGAGANATEAAEPLAVRQQIVRDRLVQLEDRMYRLSEKLRENEPEQARRLEKALRQSGEQLIRHHMDQAVQALERLELTKAAEHQAAAEKALQDVLVLLTETVDDALDRQRELDRLRDLREQVDKMLERQLELRMRTDPGEQLAERLAAAADKVRKLIARQEQQAARTKSADADQANELAESQREIRDETEAAAGELNPPATQPHGDPLAQRADQARRELEDAADRMRAAEAELSEKHTDAAESRQAEALDSLRKALEALEKAGASAQPLDAAEAARQQRALEQDAGKLADSLREKPDGDDGSTQPAEGDSAQTPPAGQEPSSGDPAENGDPQDGSDSPPAGTDKPGADNVRKAQQHMKRAGDKLEGNQPQKATADQDRAIEELERARAELQETLDQLRREQQEEALAGLEQRFRTMLIQQKSVNAATEDLDSRKDNWTRADSLNLAALAQEQTALSGEAAKALHILVEEGTTVVFPQIVAQIRDDMTEVAKRLGEKQTGQVTRDIEAQIVEALEELIAAIEQRQKEGPPPAGDNGQSGGQGGQAPDPPLLPGSAELKLLRSCQVRVNRETQQLGEAIAGAATDVGNRAERLSERQEQLADMARKINERAQRR